MFSWKQKIDRLRNLHENPEHIRNMCVIAHVDHGKTTLSDALLASNNIISKKSAGKLRYLDSRPDEQERLITMKSSSVSIHHQLDDKEYLINLIDSPGHIEFSSEVSSALRLTDGALVVVDAAEGIGSQTYTVLRQAFEERVKTVLVINKMDRLISEICLSPEEAFKHISIIIEQVNAILSSFIAENVNSLSGHLDKEKLEKFKEIHAEKENLEMLLEEAKLEEIESKVYFTPEKNNVVFASAWEGWAFTLEDFANIIAKRLKVNPKILIKYLWGEYYLNTKTRKLLSKPWDDRCKPLAVQFIFETIWAVYDKSINKETDKLKAMSKVLNIEVADKLWDVLQTDTKSFTSQFMNSWLPIDKALLKTIVTQLPNPREAQRMRLEKLSPLLYNIEENPSKDPEEQAALIKIRDSVLNCDNSEDAPLVMYISKMVSVPIEYVNEAGLTAPPLGPDQKMRFIGFARIFSGRVRRGTDVHIIYPKSVRTQEGSESKVVNEIAHATISSLYVLMALHIEGLQASSAGNIVGIGGLDNVVFKIATLSNLPFCPTFSPIQFKSMALLKVTITTPNIDDNQKLIEGLKKLNKADPAVEIYSQETGDIVLSTCGEVHLQRCVRDLEESFAKIEVRTSEPLVSFRETATHEELVETKTNDEKKVWTKNVIEKAERRQKKERKLKKIEEDIELSDDEIVTNTGETDLTEEIEGYRKRQQQKDWTAKTTGTRNKAKLLRTSQLNTIEIKKKNPFFDAVTPNQRFSVRIRTVALNFEVAEWLDKQSQLMEGLFYKDNDLTDRFAKQFQDFDEAFHKELETAEVDKQIINLIDNNLVVFGPKRSGSNLLLNKFIKPEESLIQRFRKLCPKVETEAKPEEEKKREATEKNSVIEQKAKDWEISLFNEKNHELLKEVFNFSFEEFVKAIATGFDISTRAGPLCEEPMMGVIFILEDVKLMDLVIKEEEEGVSPSTKVDKPHKEHGNIEAKGDLNQKKINPESTTEETKNEEGATTQKPLEIVSSPHEETKSELSDKSPAHSEKRSATRIESIRENPKVIEYKNDPYGPISGQIISATKEACLESFLGAGPRIVEGVLLCYMQTNMDHFGKVFDVLNRRRADVLENEMHESNNLMIIKAQLPVTESFGFYKEMLDKTSGNVNPQLEFDTWKVFAEDPFYIPQTEDELEEFGETGLVNNHARQLLDKIRRRKGLQTETKIVIAAEKQRTLSRTK